MTTEDDEKGKRWLEKLQFYTRDFTKDEAIQLTDYVVWKKCEIAINEGNTIKESINESYKIKQP